jgi:hypothetical protein
MNQVWALRIEKVFSSAQSGRATWTKRDGDEILFKLCRACLDAFAQKSCRNFGRCSSARAANMVPGCKAHG